MLFRQGMQAFEIIGADIDEAADFPQRELQVVPIDTVMRGSHSGRRGAPARLGVALAWHQQGGDHHREDQQDEGVNAYRREHVIETHPLNRVAPDNGRQGGGAARRVQAAQVLHRQDGKRYGGGARQHGVGDPFGCQPTPQEHGAALIHAHGAACRARAGDLGGGWPISGAARGGYGRHRHGSLAVPRRPGRRASESAGPCPDARRERRASPSGP